MNFNRKIETDLKFFKNVYVFIYKYIYQVLGRGYSFLCSLLTRACPSLSSVKSKIAYEDGSKFSFFMADPYWNRLFVKSYSYEPDIIYLMYKLRDIEYKFLDCGANFGYMSVVMSSQMLGGKECIAIEASPDNFIHLLENSNINNDRFKTINRAIYNEDGLEVKISTNAHSSVHQIVFNQTQEVKSVKTITVASIIEEYCLGGEFIFVKLDVEGVEFEAFQGIKQYLNSNLAVIYEEHGKDKQHTISRKLFESFNLNYYFLDDFGENMRINELSQLDALKTDIHKGYNILAVTKDSKLYEASPFIDLEKKWS